MSTLNYLGSILEGINSGINNGLKIEENRRANEVLLMRKKREREEEEEKRKEEERKKNMAIALSKTMEYYTSPDNQREAGLFTSADMRKAAVDETDPGSVLQDTMKNLAPASQPPEQKKSKDLRMFLNKFNEFMPEGQQLRMSEAMEALGMANNLAKLNFQELQKKDEETAAQKNILSDEWETAKYGQEKQLRDLKIEQQKKINAQLGRPSPSAQPKIKPEKTLALDVVIPRVRDTFSRYLTTLDYEDAKSKQKINAAMNRFTELVGDNPTQGKINAAMKTIISEITEEKGGSLRPANSKPDRQAFKDALLRDLGIMK